MMNNVTCIAIASGKGGVGKSTLTLNICSVLSNAYKVLAVDCDLGLANLDVLLGKHTTYTLQDILSDTIEPQDACIEVSSTFSLLPSASGTIESIGMDTMAIHLLFKKLDPFFETFDCVLLDLGASITPITLSFIQHATHTVIVITPEPTSIIDGYALIKVLSTRAIISNVYIICSMVENKEHAFELYTALVQNITHTLENHIVIHYLGYLEYSMDVLNSVYNQQLITERYPNSVCTQNIENIAEAIQEQIIA